MNKQRECYAFSDSMSLGEVNRHLEEMASSGWRLPDTEELSEVIRNEEVRLPTAIDDIPIQWYWSNTPASESSYGGVREGVDSGDKETREVVKCNGRESDSAILDHYGTVFVRYR